MRFRCADSYIKHKNSPDAKIAPGVCYSNFKVLKSNTASRLSVEYVFPSYSSFMPLLSAEISNCFENRRMPLSFIDGHSPLSCGFILSLFRPTARSPKSPSVTTLANSRLSAARCALLPSGYASNGYGQCEPSSLFLQ